MQEGLKQFQQRSEFQYRRADHTFRQYTQIHLYMIQYREKD